MAHTSYPMAANCNYESADDTTIHQIRQAIDTGLTDDETLLSAMADLENALLSELSDSGDYVRGALSAERLNDAEAAVTSAWTSEVQTSVSEEKESRYRD